MDGWIWGNIPTAEGISRFATLIIVPTMGGELIMYLLVSPTAVSAVLIQEEDKVQKPVYYVSKVFMET